jgi:hypothetical protein
MVLGSDDVKIQITEYKNGERYIVGFHHPTVVIIGRLSEKIPKFQMRHFYLSCVNSFEY